MKIPIVMAALVAVALSQNSELGPRSMARLESSASGEYLISFPPPNECVSLGKITASSREQALYRAVSKGGFTLKPGRGGLTVWTVEEWNDLDKEHPEFAKELEKHCREKP